MDITDALNIDKSPERKSPPLSVTGIASEIVVTAEEEARYREYVLACLRRACLHMKLADADLVSVGTALKGGFINSAQALAWIEDLGAMPLLEMAEAR